MLFNRFYQPDLDLETLDVVPRLELSQPWEMRLPLRWIAILRPQLGPDVSLAATSGVQSGADVVKGLLVGADVVMMTSALLRHGPEHVAAVEAELRAWMAEHEYESVAQLRGSARPRPSTTRPRSSGPTTWRRSTRGRPPNPEDQQISSAGSPSALLPAVVLLVSYQCAWRTKDWEASTHRT